jgi:hypothetical protein
MHEEDRSKMGKEVFDLLRCTDDCWISDLAGIEAVKDFQGFYSYL